jgi:hypothetical protein
MRQLRPERAQESSEEGIKSLPTQWQKPYRACSSPSTHRTVPKMNREGTDAPEVVQRFQRSDKLRKKGPKRTGKGTPFQSCRPDRT